VQLEFETEWGTTIQCGDLIIQKAHPFVPASCDPKCQNGGVCSNGLCRCSKMFVGDQCEVRVQPNGSLNLIMFVLVILITAIGIMFFLKNEKQKRDMEKAFQQSQWNYNN